MSARYPIREGQLITGALFNEPMRVETVKSNGTDSWVIGLIGTRSERFRRVTLSNKEIETLTILDSKFNYTGDGRLLRLGIQAYSLGIVYEFDPYLASLSPVLTRFRINLRQ